MKYRICGKEKKLAFGPWPDVSLFKARQLHANRGIRPQYGRPCKTIILDTGAFKKALNNALAIAESRNYHLIDKPDLIKCDGLLA
jgi:hypothetical protein